VVERVTYHNAENGFCVLRIKARGLRDIATMVGHSATIAAGEWITASEERLARAVDAVRRRPTAWASH
jgi:exodeoxyribonuclease V alpha subunit